MTQRHVWKHIHRKFLGQNGHKTAEDGSVNTLTGYTACRPCSCGSTGRSGRPARPPPSCPGSSGRFQGYPTLTEEGEGQSQTLLPPSLTVNTPLLSSLDPRTSSCRVSALPQNQRGKGAPVADAAVAPQLCPFTAPGQHEEHNI